MTETSHIAEPLGRALTKRGYETLTPVQIAASDPELQNEDLLVSAQTGSGKTVAFGIAIAPSLLGEEDRMGRADMPLALVVAPTRELALQVGREFEWLYELTGARIASCVGGMDMRTERRALSRGAHIVVGTPGRLRDHIERGSLELGQVKAVVLDEADEMLDLGFRDDLEYILDASPSHRRTLLFSATVPRSITNLAKRYQRDAVRVSTTQEREQHLDIDYQGLVVAPNDRENAIINVLRYFDVKNALVFCATRATVNHMTSRLNNRGFSVVALSGELSQNERTHALQAMRDGRAQVCVATDVAARGIDLPNLDLVIHADLPRNSEALLHRSGRTGRAGRKGTSILIVPHNARRRTERLLGNSNVDVSWGKPPSLKDIEKKDRERILSDELLSLPLSKEDTSFAEELLARYQPEQIAAAYYRLHKKGQPAPEELLDAQPIEPAKARREDFKDGVWFSLSVGRKEQAEARWLLPMLCRVGHITKNEIGAIRIYQSETHFELTPESVDKFLKEVGPSRKVEKNIVLTSLEGKPEPIKEDVKRPAKNEPFRRGGRAGKERAPRKKVKPKGANSEDTLIGRFKPKSAPHKSSKKQSSKEQADHDKNTNRKSNNSPAKKPKPAKRFKKNLSSASTDGAGASPLKRKKPKKSKRT